MRSPLSEPGAHRLPIIVIGRSREDVGMARKDMGIPACRAHSNLASSAGLRATGDAAMKFEQLALHYRGDAAKTYDAVRSRHDKWISEQRIVETLLTRLPPGSSIIDIPIGTGRFVDEYHRLRLMPTGMDISPDMIAIAAGKAERAGLNIPLHTGDIRRIQAADGAFDTALCICFLNWVDINGAREALRELVRVARKNLIVSIRYYVPFEKLRPATPEGFLQAALQGALRVHKVFSRSSLRVHEEAEVFAMFEECGLTLKQQFRVEPRKYGTDYYIYFLEKSQ